MFKMNSFVPDFERIKTTLQFQEPDRVPNFEISVARPVRESLLGTNLPDGVESEIIWRPRLGYDYIFVIPSYQKPPVLSRPNLKAVSESGAERSWIDQHSQIITDWQSFKDYHDYPEPVEPLDLTEVRKAIAVAKRMPGNVGVGALLPSCPFTEINLLMGYEEFSLKLFDNYALCLAVVEMLGKVGVASIRQLACENINFIFFGDDMAYTGGMMISPETMRKLFFPWYKQFIEIARDNGKLIMFHSDGNIEPVIPDFIKAGLNGLNPIEPLAMDIVELKRKYGKQLALIGNIDVDLLSRGCPPEVETLVKTRLEQLKPGGGYMMASSNSICDYVKLANFQAMLEANYHFGHY